MKNSVLNVEKCLNVLFVDYHVNSESVQCYAAVDAFLMYEYHGN